MLQASPHVYCLMYLSHLLQQEWTIQGASPPHTGSSGASSDLPESTRGYPAIAGLVQP